MTKIKFHRSNYLLLIGLTCLLSGQLLAQTPNKCLDIFDNGVSSQATTVPLPSFLDYSYLKDSEKREKEIEFQKSYRESWNKPTDFNFDYVIYKGKIFPNAYYRSKTFSSYGSQRVSEKPANVIGRSEPYWELSQGIWKMKKKAPKVLLEMILTNQKTIKLYRGANAQEAGTWQLLKDWSSSSEIINKEDIDRLDQLLQQSSTLPWDFVNTWKNDLRSRALAGSMKANEVSTLLLPFWKNELSTYFTTNSAEAAYEFGINRWQGDDRKNGRVIEFTVPTEALFSAENEPYAGFEDGYLEVGFSTDPSIKLLLNSLTRTDITDANFSALNSSSK